MDLTSRGRHIEVDGKPYYVGMPVIAQNCAYDGLCGTIIGIGTLGDSLTDSSEPFFYCRFPYEIQPAKEQLLNLYMDSVSLNKEKLDCVALNNKMLRPDNEKSIIGDSVKRVVYNNISLCYEQWQAIQKAGQTLYTLQIFDEDLQLIDELETNYFARQQVEEHWNQKCTTGFFKRVLGISCDVLRPTQIGDCTNSGISRWNDVLYLFGEGIKGNTPIKDIRTAVNLFIRGGVFQCKPVIFHTSWHMSGGNFIYSSDAVFHRLCPYPIAIHDRREDW